MGESAWVDIGAALKTLFQAQMGMSSAYTTLRLRQVLVTMLRDPSDWDGWASADLLPTLIIEGRFSRPQAREHGTILGARRIQKEYPHIIGVIADGEREEAERNAKILIKRIERSVLTTNTLVVTDTTGEQVQDMRLDGTTGVNLFRKPGSELHWYGIGAVALTVRTFTGA